MKCGSPCFASFEAESCCVLGRTEIEIKPDGSSALVKASLSLFDTGHNQFALTPRSFEVSIWREAHLIRVALRDSLGAS